jgi:hypothetical protein
VKIFKIDKSKNLAYITANNVCLKHSLHVTDGKQVIAVVSLTGVNALM